MAGARLAAHQKKARRQGAGIAPIGESGLPMAPPVRRTWAPRGRAPELGQKGGSREKVSIAAAVWLPPRRDRLGLYFHALPDGYTDSWHIAAFLGAMLKDPAGRFVVVWDGGPMHEGDPIRDLMGHSADRLDLERLPPYAPMLNPVGPLWSWLKWGRPSDLGPEDAAEIDTRATAELARVRRDRAFLRNLFHASDLPLPRAFAGRPMRDGVRRDGVRMDRLQ